MALKFYDRVLETSVTTGTGPLSLLGPSAGFRAFSSTFSVGNAVLYVITDGTNWEVGSGVLSAAETLTRTTVYEGSNGTSLVNFTSAVKLVTNDITASWLNDVDNLRYGQSNAAYGAALLQYMATGASAVVRTQQSKSQEIYSVLDTGADPTGAADSSTAFTNAASNPGGQYAMVPPGTYLLNSFVPYTFYSMGGVTLTGTGGCYLIGLPTVWSTGDVKLTIKTAADPGWVMCNDGTIGNASSGATERTNADCLSLYTTIWNNIPNTYALVTGGRGATGLADFNAGKPIQLLTMMGRALAVAGSGTGLTSRALGQFLGEENHNLTSAENGPHNHPISDPGHAHPIIPMWIQGPYGYIVASFQLAAQPGYQSSWESGATNSAYTGILISSSGSGTGHNTMQPTTFLNAMIKL